METNKDSLVGNEMELNLKITELINLCREDLRKNEEIMLKISEEFSSKEFSKQVEA